MGCGGIAKDGVATCVCSGQTVFEGAVIGQVFTGDVQVQCPHLKRAEPAAPAEPERPIASAMLAIAIWQSLLALPVIAPPASASLPHAALFLVGGVAARYWKRRHGKALMRYAGRILPDTHWLRLSSNPCTGPSCKHRAANAKRQRDSTQLTSGNRR